MGGVFWGKMEKKSSHRSQDILAGEGRDELNLAEFPIALLSSRPDQSLKTIHFEDRIWDRGHGACVTRRLTISASDKYGLPTALDDEVILGLIQLTRKADFENRQVFFSRYQLLRLLGWRNEGKSYSRLETSLKRWVGVTFYYENAWWDKGSQGWVDESFHLLEQVSLFDRNQRSQGMGNAEIQLSMFTWNEVVFRSFQAGYLKRIDLGLFRRLQSPVTKRLYRLLDKRFYHKPCWRFDLRELACEHVGLSRNYDTGQLKRKLRPAIEELEAIGYLMPVEPDRRFLRVEEGRWQVQFTQGRKRKSVERQDPMIERLKTDLCRRGIRPETADKLVSDFSAELIGKQITALDRLLKQNGCRIRNAAGYLVQSIRKNYEPTDNLSSSKTRGCRRSSTFSRNAGLQDVMASPEKRAEDRAGRLDRYLESLHPAKKQRLQDKALAWADADLAEVYHRAVAEGASALANVYGHLILERYVASQSQHNKHKIPTENGLKSSLAGALRH